VAGRLGLGQVWYKRFWGVGRFAVGVIDSTGVVCLFD